MIKESDKYGIYIHIPFCVKKCAYCDFLSAPPRDVFEMHDYVESLCREIELRNRTYFSKFMHKNEADTVFFGGGTPSLLEISDFNSIMRTLRQNFEIAEDAEITVECNPDTVDFDKLKNYKEQGVNRISFGLQAASDKELKMLGRIHSYAGFLESYEAAKKAGFDNINIDLISAIPGQTVKGWEDTLKKVAGLAPEHISAYSLILEEGTKLFEEKDFFAFPTEEEDAQMYSLTERVLNEYGYKRYEISNYAKAGYESRHNNKYWQRKKYFGFGTGAASFTENRRFSNIKDLNKYNKILSENGDVTDYEEVVTLSKDDKMAEFFYLGLRRMEGVFFNDFEEEFGVPPEEIYGGVIEKLIRQGLLEYIQCTKISATAAADADADISAAGIRLTERGIFLSNRVFVEFI